MDNDDKQRRFNQVDFLAISLGITILYLAAIGAKDLLSKNNNSVSNVILINDKDASIVNISNEHIDDINENILVLEMDNEQREYNSYLIEESNLSVNDIAVYFVGEDGDVTYYGVSDEKSKILINTKENSIN